MPTFLKDVKEFWDSLSKSTRISVVVVLTLLWIAFLPTLQYDYVPQDQWRAFRYEEVSAFGKLKAIRNMLPAFYVRTGRPLVWIGECLEHMFVNRISDFNLLRPLCLVIYIGAGFALALALWRACGIMPVALGVSLLFLFIPGVSFMYFQGMTGAPVTLCLGLAAISYYWLTSPPLRQAASRGWRSRQSQLCAGVAFMAALMIYPAWAMIVVPLSLLGFAFREPESNHERMAKLLKTLVFYLACAILYYAVIKLLIAINFMGSRRLPHQQGYEFSMNLAPQLLWERFLEVVTFASSASIVPVLGWGKGAGALILAGFSVLVGLKLADGMKNSGRRWAVMCSMAVFPVSLLILAGSVSPWVLSGQVGLATRHAIPINLFLIAVVVVGLWKVGEKLHQGVPLFLVLLTCALAALSQNKLSTCEVINSGLEITEMRNAVSKWLEAGGPEKRQGIVVVRPSSARHPLITELKLPNEAFGNNGVLTSRCNPEHIKQMINAFMRENMKYCNNVLPEIKDCRFDQKMALEAMSSGQIVLQLTKSGEYIAADNDSFVINLSSLGGATPQKRGLAPGDKVSTRSNFWPDATSSSQK